MLEKLGGFFRKESQDTLVLAYSDVPAWLEDQENRMAADPGGTARQYRDEIAQIIDRLRQDLNALQAPGAAGSGEAGSGAAPPDSLGPFLQQVSGPLSVDLPEEICPFFAIAENLFGTCNEAVAGHGPALAAAFPALFPPVKRETQALGKALLLARKPVIETCRARKQRIANVKAVLAKIAEVEQDATGTEDRIAWLKSQVLEITEELGRIRAEREALDADPGPFIRQQQEMHDNLARARDELRRRFTARAEIVAALMLWARTIASGKGDSYGSDVLFELIQLLTGKDVPAADSLMPALACAFEIVLDMMENGDLVPADNEAAAVLTKPAECNRDLCRICREYADTDAQLKQVVTGPDGVAHRIRQLADEEDALGARVRDHETAELDLATQRMLAARQQWSLKKPLEDAISSLAGSKVKIRLNGESVPGLRTD